MKNVFVFLEHPNGGADFDKCLAHFELEDNQAIRLVAEEDAPQGVPKDNIIWQLPKTCIVNETQEYFK